MSDHPISPETVESLAEKLEAFCRTLTPAELVAFEVVEAQLSEWTDQEADVHGYMLNPTSVPDAARLNQHELLREADRQRRILEATGSAGGSERRKLWRALLARIGSRDATRSAPQLRPAPGAPTGD
jgi:hypothetical protein